MIDIIYDVSKVGNQGIGTLIVLDDGKYTEFLAKSGPWGKGCLPLGIYNVGPVRDLEKTDSNKAFFTADCKYPFFVPIYPIFHTERNSLGIHPDGNVPGSEGCIVIPNGAGAWKFYEAIKKLSTKKLLMKVA